MAGVLVTESELFTRVELDRSPLNVIDLAMAHELAAALESLRRSRDLRILVLSGRGTAFSSGVDVRDHLPDRGAEMLHVFHRACIALFGIPVPVIAAVQGPALGGGCELTLCCDTVIASTSATFGFPEIKLGVFPPLAAVALPRMIPAHVAVDLILTGRTLPAEEAQRVGLVNRVVPAAGLAAAVEEAVSALAALSPSSLRLTKRAATRHRVTAEEIAESERFYVEDLMSTPDAIEGLRAFMEKRTPEWSSAREPSGANRR